MGTKFFVVLSLASFVVSTFGSDIITHAIGGGERRVRCENFAVSFRCETLRPSDSNYGMILSLIPGHPPPEQAPYMKLEQIDNETIIATPIRPLGSHEKAFPSITIKSQNTEHFNLIAQILPNPELPLSMLFYDLGPGILLIAFLIAPFLVLAFICGVVERKTRRHSGLAVFALFDLVLSYFYFTGYQASEAAFPAPTSAILDITLLPVISMPVLAVASIVGGAAPVSWTLCEFEPRLASLLS
jgi:hypothetical protein